MRAEADMRRADIVRRIAVARRQAQEVRAGIGYGGPDEKKRRALREAGLCDRHVGDLEAALGAYDRTHPMADTETLTETE